MKTSELTGAALDWAVAKAEGLSYRYDEKYGPMCFRPSVTKGVVHWDSQALPYSTDWSQGGPIIGREGIELLCNLTATEAARFTNAHADWQAFYRQRRGADQRSYGTTPLIAAMRCFVASKLGDEVDVPKELM